jgi:HD-like signal output (HDOD) protein
METRKLLDNMYREGIRFPMLPSALIRVNTVLQDPNSSLNDLASVPKAA